MTEPTNHAPESASQSSDDLEVPAQRRRRSPVISAIVLLLGGYLMVSMFADVRYFLSGSEPTDLGTVEQWIASDAAQNGANDEDYVTLRGTPNTQTAARYKLENRNVMLLPFAEAPGSLFVAAEGSGRTDRVEEVFTGRLRRLSNTRILPWIEQYYSDLKLTRNVDLDPTSLVGASGTLKTVDGQSIAVRADDEVSVVVSQPQARVQLGRASFKSQARARKALDALGYPVFAPAEQTNSKFYQYWVQIPEAERESAQTQLNVGLEIVGSAKATHGAVVLGSRSTYVVPLADLSASPDGLTLVHKDQMPPPGYVVEGDHLVVRPLTDGHFSVANEAVEAVRLQQPLQVDPNGYILNAGESPSEHLFSLCMWLAVLLVVGLNLTGLVLQWRANQE